LSFNRDSKSTYGEDYDVDDGDAYDSSDGDTLEEEFSVSQMDNQYFMPSSVNLVVTLGCMMLSSRIDFFNPTFVRIVRCVSVVSRSQSIDSSHLCFVCRLAFIIEVLIQVSISRGIVVGSSTLSISQAVIEATVHTLRSPNRQTNARHVKS